jgi:hypothetical protein
MTCAPAKLLKITKKILLLIEKKTVAHLSMKKNLFFHTKEINAREKREKRTKSSILSLKTIFTHEMEKNRIK